MDFKVSLSKTKVIKKSRPFSARYYQSSNVTFKGVRRMKVVSEGVQEWKLTVAIHSVLSQL